MKVMVLPQPGPVESAPLHLMELPTPEPGPGEILIRVEVCGVCRTDLHIIEGELSLHRQSTIPCHEAIGRVIAAVAEETQTMKKEHRNMNIGIIGSGNIGATAARLFIAAGHSVAISNSRGPETLQSLVAELGAQAHATRVEDAAFSGKIVPDAKNYYPPRDGNIPELDADRTTSSELLAVHLPEAQVIKAVNTFPSHDLATEGNTSLPIDERSL